MTLDWFVLLTPALLALVALPFLFIGCAQFEPEKVTTFQLNLAHDLQENKERSRPRGDLVEATITWTLSNSKHPSVTTIGSGPQTIKSGKIHLHDPPSLDTYSDDPAVWRMNNDDIGTRDIVTWDCTVKLQGDEEIKAVPAPASVDVEIGRMHTFRITPLSVGRKRGFLVVFEGVG
jgi:hypothetical protein